MKKLEISELSGVFFSSILFNRKVIPGEVFAWKLLKVCLIAVLIAASGCTPTIKVEAPSKPIEINLNIKIEHEIRIKVDKDLETLFEDESDIF